MNEKMKKVSQERLNKIINDSMCLSITPEMLKENYISKSESEKKFLEIAKKMMKQETNLN